MDGASALAPPVEILQPDVPHHPWRYNGHHNTLPQDKGVSTSTTMGLAHTHTQSITRGGQRTTAAAQCVAAPVKSNVRKFTKLATAGANAAAPYSPSGDNVSADAGTCTASVCARVVSVPLCVPELHSCKLHRTHWKGSESATVSSWPEMAPLLEPTQGTTSCLTFSSHDGMCQRFRTQRVSHSIPHPLQVATYHSGPKCVVW